jgi:DNA-binding SARP family transcriptional activator
MVLKSISAFFFERCHVENDVPRRRRSLNSFELSAAAFADSGAEAQMLMRTWLTPLRPRRTHVLLIAEPTSTVRTLPQALIHPARKLVESPTSMRLSERSFSSSAFEANVVQRLAQERGRAGSPDQPVVDDAWAVVVDMDWVLSSPAAAANISVWGGTVQRLVEQVGVAVLCIYHQRHLTERVLLAGLHAHFGVVTQAGCQPNPYRLPDAIAANPAAWPRFEYWLAQLGNPGAEYAGAAASPQRLSPAQGASTGLQESTLPEDFVPARPAAAQSPDDERWKVRCFGGLRVYRADGTHIAWETGSAAAVRQMRCLFAFLLLRGAKGASSQELIQMLWPDAASAAHAANRLHHTISGLRQALVGATTRMDARSHPYLLREDGRYVLRPPANTWLDVYDFEQLCRQGGTLLGESALEEALMCLESALSLYTGDLFEGLPAAFVESRDPDWCWSRRYWFREMSFKVHRDCASIYRQQGNFLAAIKHCHRALSADPAAEIAHMELMRIYAAQGRGDALERQFRQYKLALAATDQAPSDNQAQSLYFDLRAKLRQGRP